MRDSPVSALQFGRTTLGFLIRVLGRGTNRESIALDHFVSRLTGNAHRIDIDLSQCTYLDSTFLGCLLGLHKHSAEIGARFQIVAPSNLAQEHLESMRLNTILHVSSDPAPPVVGTSEQIEPDDSSSEELCRHVLHCHRRLAEIDGPNQGLFSRIVDQLDREARQLPSPSARVKR